MSVNIYRKHFRTHSSSWERESVKVVHLTAGSSRAGAEYYRGRGVNTRATGNEFIINRFAILYNLCCDSMDLINACFGVQLLLFTCVCFVYQIFSIFAMFHLWYQPPPPAAAATGSEAVVDTSLGSAAIIVFEQLLWSAYYYSVVIAIISVASSLTNTVSNT